MKKDKEELISMFTNGKQRYKEQDMFKSVIDAIVIGVDKLALIDILLKNIEANQKNVELLKQTL